MYNESRCYSPLLCENILTDGRQNNRIFREKLRKIFFILISLAIEEHFPQKFLKIFGIFK